MTIYLSHECPLACGELIFVQSKIDEKIFFHCVTCSTAFKCPEEMQNGTKLNLSRNLYDLSPEGVKLPTKQSIEKFGFLKYITDTTNECSLYSIEEIHKNVYTEIHT